ncbi:cytochrome d ubiquinol oxidase subunit II [Salinivibrio sp. MA351]|jgi:cytochrome d ubiquinol oxidase subunit II|uniref:Cytochrome d ubiquinol oxidase subunit II n=1 Tax=Salinivibrio costicola subsp. alcaliphilus TaxID=272773 RepID=A0ABX3KP61_SALCS|nr:MULTISPECIES: cytochrome d ubiquinol oxidase subunit II [Salinivibrio]NUY57607.1 cytochrome d ubiquinol oxidase subunit II [Salinivibrio sp. EAGSL]OOE88720.1 cytochrome d ubiquinol oxidase subunit II [Salinivibrio sp. AR640]OOE93437.1 cytochrome d ubiquinol oxidase subunit II [Salinivibrio sp. AR647]OOE97446.1 cytochrome d ubiquinol oxidase subunit II [Salinivibrio sp. MA351]OOF02264.1 cytochrome d ubiquinol oxidase subunit II [Salinivibrio sp. MA440]
MFDYEMLRLIWWALIGVLLIGFTVTDGFDMGVGALLTLIGKTDSERRVMINSVAPHWEGNQVWLVTAGGALFAAWPLVYAVSFSGFYIAMVLTLAALFFRPMGFDYRSKIDDKRWRTAWDWGLVAGGFIPPVIFGVAFGNLLQGVPFQLSELLIPTYTGGFFALLNPFALVCGLVSLFMVVLQGATWLQMKTTDALHVRARNVAQLCALLTTVLFVAAGFWVQNLEGFVVVSEAANQAASNPLAKEVAVQSGAWMHNYQAMPILWLAPIVGAVMPLLALLASRVERGGWAFLFSSLAIAGVILTAGIAMFPFVMPSSTFPSHSLTMWDATSSELTLSIMTIVAAIFVPIILAYTLWCYIKMFGRLDAQYIEDNKHSLY